MRDITIDVSLFLFFDKYDIIIVYGKFKRRWHNLYRQVQFSRK